MLTKPIHEAFVEKTRVATEQSSGIIDFQSIKKTSVSTKSDGFYAGTSGSQKPYFVGFFDMMPALIATNTLFLIWTRVHYCFLL